MARRIYKWRLNEDRDETTVPWSLGDKVLLVDDQDGALTLWAEQEDSNADHGYRLFTVVGTGFEAPAGQVHVGSAVCGSFVWHVYVEGPI